MTPTKAGHGGQSYALAALILAQAACAAFFLWDISGDVAALKHRVFADLHILTEIFANLGLIAAIAVEARVLTRLLRRQQHDARALSIASGALYELIEGWFADWRLTPAEADVAMFAIKGFSIAEIARLRGSAEPTVKTHLNAIYRKAGVPGRAQLASLMVEELLGRPLVEAGPRRPAREASGAG
jgi:DNA-binding CsgD family transcriptional regulator